MTDLIEPAKPEDIDPAPHPAIAGNWQDDDGESIDEWFEAPDLGPQVYGVPAVPVVPDVPAATRLLTREFSIGAQSGSHIPLLVLPADPNRLKLIVGLEADTRIASEQSDVFFAVAPGATALLDMDGHTGALWAYSTNTSANLVVKVWSITR